MTSASLPRVSSHALHRRHLPDERKCIVHEFCVGGWQGKLRVGLFPDGTVGETFLEFAKEGSTTSGFACGVMIAWSMMLQYGVPLGVLVKKYKGMNFEPNGVASNEEIPYARSILDYIARWLELRFIPEAERDRDE